MLFCFDPKGLWTGISDLFNCRNYETFKKKNKKKSKQTSSQYKIREKHVQTVQKSGLYFVLVFVVDCFFFSQVFLLLCFVKKNTS